MTTRYLTLPEVLALHAEAIRLHGGGAGVRDLGLIESATQQPQMGYGDAEFYPTLAEKAAVIGYSLTKNHGFIDGNKRVGFAALDTFLRVNGCFIEATADAAEAICLGVASGSASRDDLTAWVHAHVQPLPPAQA